MAKLTTNSFSNYLILTSILIVTSFFHLKFIDPFNLPKMGLLVIFTSIMLGLNLFALFRKFHKPNLFSILIFLMFLQCIFVTLFSQRTLSQNIYGNFARNTGLITFLSLIIVMVCASLYVTDILIKGFLKISSLTIFVVSVIGFIQFFGLYEPLKAFNYKDGVFATLGNPNFYSAILGLNTILLLPKLFNKNSSFRNKGFIVIFEIFLLWSIYLTKSVQGYYLTLIGLVIFIYLLFINDKMPILKVIILTFIIALGSVSSLGFINRGPFAKFIFIDSVEDRKYCWDAAFNMIMSKPLFGSGFDSYSDKFRQVRSIEAYNFKGTNQICDTAHNVFLDIAVSGGIPLLLMYLVLLILVVINFFKIITSNQSNKLNICGVFSAWAAFQIQSIISINQIGLAIWGSVMSGILLGVSPNSNVSLQYSTIKLKQIISITISSIVALSLILPPLVNTYRYSQAYKKKDASALISVSKQWPRDPKLMIMLASDLEKSNFSQQSLNLLKAIVVEYPNEYDAYKLIAFNKLANKDDVENANNQIIRLDPLANQKFLD